MLTARLLPRVGEVVTIGTTMSQSRGLPALAEARKNIWCTVGVHPHHAAEAPIPALPRNAPALAEHPRVIGIGESGLDYFYDRAPRDVQRANFRAHIRAARLAGVPLAIHARDADSDIADILENEYDNGGHFTFLLHCFSSSRILAERAVAIGGYVSFSGILTFPKSSELRGIARDLPPDRSLLGREPMPPISPRCRSGGSGTNRLLSPIRLAFWQRSVHWNLKRSPT